MLFMLKPDGMWLFREQNKWLFTFCDEWQTDCGIVHYSGNCFDAFAPTQLSTTSPKKWWRLVSDLPVASCLASRWQCVCDTWTKTQMLFSVLIGCRRYGRAWTLPRWSDARARCVSTPEWHLSSFCKQVFCYGALQGCFLLAPAGFGGRGVLPGVATGTDLNHKSCEMNLFSAGCWHLLSLVIFQL